jgi:transaldolase
MMSIWYDGVQINELNTLFRRGIIKGVTTNLTMVNNSRRSTGRSRVEVLTDIAEFCAVHGLPLSVQVEKSSVGEIVVEAGWLKRAFPNNLLHVKIPVNSERLEAIHKLTAASISVNATCVTSCLQAIVAAEAGASIISFFVGKMSDQNIDPWKCISDFRDYIDRRNLDAKILCGSFRQTEMIKLALTSGSDVVTVPFDLIIKCGNQLQSDEATSIFESSLEGL